MKKSAILLRVTSVGYRERLFADKLEESSSLMVIYLVDGRVGNVPEEKRPLIVLNDKSCLALELPLVELYPWRCGDYGLYLARQRYPGISYFWLIEGDVRFSCHPATAFFQAMKQSKADLLAAYIRRAEKEWYWTPHGRGRGVTPYRCLYSVIRVSSLLIDTMLHKRVSHGKSILRRSLWGNDEVFTCTTAINGNFLVLDINAVSGSWYRPSHYAYNVTLDGDNINGTQQSPELLHSVRFDQYVTKRSTHPLFDMSWKLRYGRKIAIKLSRHFHW